MAGIRRAICRRAAAGESSARGSLPGPALARWVAQTDAEHAVIDTIKGAEDGDGLIVRVYESQGARGPVKLRMGFPVQSAQECNLMEDAEADAPVADNAISFSIKPYEIKTFRVRPRAGRLSEIKL